MFQEAVRSFAQEKVRPAALAADDAAAAPEELLVQAAELGVNMLGVPEELGGVMGEQSAVTSVLVGEALAHGDMGIAYAALAPGAVATAIGRWGSAEQEATYLPAFTGEDTPAAALAILEPRPLFDPLKLQDDGKKDGGRLGPRRRQVVARPRRRVRAVLGCRRGGGDRSGAVRNRVRNQGPLGRRPSRRWDCEQPATGRLLLEGVQLAPEALLGEGKSSETTSSASTARGSPGARSRWAPPRPSSTT